MPHRFHVNEVPESGRVTLGASAARHLVVLGLGEGSEVVLFDGTGREARARIESRSVDSASAVVLAASEVSREAEVAVTLACAVPKGRRMDGLVRMCAELGVARIVPLMTRRTVVKLPEGDADSNKLDRWKKLCQASAEQSGRNVLTEIAAAAGMGAMLKGIAEFDLAVILTPDKSAPPMREVLAAGIGAKSVCLFIGPEGDFTPEEVQLAIKAGVKPARLTSSILRVDTAAVTAVAMAVLTLSE